ncbi:MAG: Zn-ribbon domain-containing OB-fold protein [Candidatus Aenigmatarchaeota archaeon]
MAHESVPLFWRLKENRYNLVGTECKTCGKKFFPPRFLCTICRRRGKIEKYTFSRKGKIISFTIIHVAPAGFEKIAPYAVALIEVDGVLISGQITSSDLDIIKDGSVVVPVFRKMSEGEHGGLIYYGIKWKIVEN